MLKGKNDKRNEENNIFEEMFEIRGQDDMFTSEIRKARKKTIIRSIVISIVVSLALFALLFGLSVLVEKRMQAAEEKADTERAVFNRITSANVYKTGSQSVRTDLFSGIITYGQYKIIDGRPIDWGEENVSFGLFKDAGPFGGDYSPIHIEQGGNNRGYDKNTKQLIMEFYHPQGKYESVINDFSLVAKMPETKAAEMAISFSKKLTPEQVRNIIPHDVSLHWYWVDTYDIKDKTNMDTSTSPDNLGGGMYGFEHRKDTVSEELFLRELKDGLAVKDGKYYQEFKQIYDQLKGNQKKIQEDQISIIGVVISGTPKELMKVKALPEVRTGVLGAITDNY